MLLVDASEMIAAIRQDFFVFEHISVRLHA